MFFTKHLTASSGTASKTQNVATYNHTHSVTADGGVTLADTATSGGVTFISSVSGASPTTKYLTVSSSSGSADDTALVATSGHTHSVTANGSVSLSLLDSSDTGTVEVVTALTGASGTTKYLTASAGSSTKDATVPTAGHTHKVTASGSVSLGLNDTASGGTALITALDAVSSVGGSVSLNSSATTSTGAIKYMQEAEHSHTEASVSDSATGLTSISGGSLSLNTKYLKIDK